MTSKATRRFAGLAASVAWAALLLQLWLTVNVVLGQGRGFAMGLVVYFGFFTVLTNVLAAVCLSYPGYLSLLGWHHVFFDRVAVDDTTRLH